MSLPNTSEKSVYLDREEHDHKGSVGAKKVVVYYYDSGTDTLKPVNDDNPLPISGGGGGVSQPTTEVSTDVANSTSNQTALAQNTSRKMATFYNDDTPTTGASVYLKCGATASATSFKIKIAPGGYFELLYPVYTGIIDVIATANTGTLRVCEST